MNTRTIPWRAVALVLMVAAVGALHFGTGTEHHRLHELYSRLSYLPIVLAAAWYGLAGGLTVGLVSGLIFLPHIAHDFGGQFFTAHLNWTFEIVLYPAVGALTGWLFDRRRRAGEVLEERNRQLIELEEGLRRNERLALVGQVAAGLAHELRNPLGAIQQAAEALGDHFKEGDEGFRMSRLLVREVERLDGVVGGLLERSRPRPGSGRLAAPVPSKPGASDAEASFETALAFEDARALLEGRFRQAGVVLDVDLPDGRLPRLAGARDQLVQVLLNLLLNAVDHTDPGGRAVITAVPREESRDVEIRVEDTGCGIAPDVLPKVFQPFFTTRPGGTGLGLPMVKRALEEVGGRVELVSQVGKGTSVRLYWPVARS